MCPLHYLIPLPYLSDHLYHFSFLPLTLFFSYLKVLYIYQSITKLVVILFAVGFVIKIAIAQHHKTAGYSGVTRMINIVNIDCFKQYSIIIIS